MNSKKRRDRRIRSERTREAKKAHIATVPHRRDNELLALSERRAALERARAEGNTLDKSSTLNRVRQNLILSTSSATPDLPHVYAPMNELPNRGFIESTFDGELIQVSMEIDPIFSSSFSVPLSPNWSVNATSSVRTHTRRTATRTWKRISAQ